MSGAMSTEHDRPPSTAADPVRSRRPRSTRLTRSSCGTPPRALSPRRVTPRTRRRGPERAVGIRGWYSNTTMSWGRPSGASGRPDDEDHPCLAPARRIGDDRDRRRIRGLGQDHDREIGEIAKAELDIAASSAGPGGADAGLMSAWSGSSSGSGPSTASGVGASIGVARAESRRSATWPTPPRARSSTTPSAVGSSPVFPTSWTVRPSPAAASATRDAVPPATTTSS